MDTQSYLVALQAQAAPDYRVMAKILAKEAGVPQFKLMKEIRECGGILVEDLPREKAERLVTQLNANSVPSFHAPQSDLVALPGAFLVREASATEKEIVVKGRPASGSALRVTKIKIPWKRITMLAAARVRGEEEYRTTKSFIDFRPPVVTAGGITPSRQYRRFKRTTKKRTKWQYFLDAIVAEPPLDIRFAASGFRYASLGIPLLRTSFENFCTLIKYMCLNCQEGIADRSVQLVLDGNPLTRLDSHSDQAYNDYLRWKLLLRSR